MKENFLNLAKGIIKKKPQPLIKHHTTEYFFSNIINQTSMSPIQDNTGDPSQYSKVNKRIKRNQIGKEETKVSLFPDRTVQVEKILNLQINY